MNDKARINIALKLIVDAIRTDGAHYKQWYLSEIAKVLLNEELPLSYSQSLDDAPECDAFQEWRKQFIEIDNDTKYDAYDSGIAP